MVKDAEGENSSVMTTDALVSTTIFTLLLFDERSEKKMGRRKSLRLPRKVCEPSSSKTGYDPQAIRTTEKPSPLATQHSFFRRIMEGSSRAPLPKEMDEVTSCSTREQRSLAAKSTIAPSEKACVL